MYLVTVYEEYISEKKYEFPTLVEANNFLFEDGFVYDSFDDEAHLWVFSDHVYGTIEKIDK